MQEKKFIEKGARKVRLHEYLEEQLEGAGYSHSDIVRTPTSTKIVIFAQRPGLVIGRGGSRIKELTTDMEKEFDFENPQIEVNEVEQPDAEAEVVAKSMASWLEKGGQPKRVGYTYLRRMKEAGVIGAEIEISGKLSGNRGRTEKFSFGYVKRCGDTSKQNVEQAYRLARTKPGAIGVKVRIMKKMPDFMHRDVDVEEELLHETVEHGDVEPKERRLEKILAAADHMTSAEIEEAMEDLEIETGDITIDEVRDAFEEKESGETLTEDEETEEAEETGEKGEDGDEDEDVTKEEEEGDSGSGVDYDEIVSGTISDAKDALEEVENVDWEAALEAEKDNKNRTTFIDWLETRVSG